VKGIQDALIAEIERRAALACPITGPDYAAILAAVAEENAADLDALKQAWIEATIAGPC